MPVTLATHLRVLVLTLLVSGHCLHAQAAVTIEPSEITAGSKQQITLSVDPPKSIDSISLQPGGPILQQRLSLDDENHDYQILRRHNGTYVRDQHNKVIAFFAAGQPNASNRHFQFTTAAEQGVLVYKEYDWDRKSPVARYRTSSPALDISVSDELAFVATGAGGLTVLGVDKLKQPQWLGSHQKLGHAIKVSNYSRQVAVLNDRNQVFLIDASQPAEPTTLSTYRSEEALLDIALHGNQLFALTKHDIQIIDVSAETPQLSNEGLDFGQGVNLGGERRVYIENDLAYVADWFSGIHIYDLSRPHQPELLSSFHTPGSPKGIVVRDDIAYVADDDHGLQVIDVSDPQQPVLITSLLTNGLAYTPRLVDNLLYLASHRGGFQIIDISNPGQPVLLGEYDTAGKAWSLEVYDEIAYIADDDSGLLLFEVSNPAKPELIGQYATGAAAEEVIIRDGIAYVAFFDDGLHILDISDPRQPKLLGQLAIPGNARGLDLVEDTLYVAGWLSGVHVVDIKHTDPKLLGSHDSRGAAWGLKVIGNDLYIMDWWGGVSVLDISDSTQPLPVGGYHDRGLTNHIALQGDYAFVAQGSNGLQVFDIRNRLNPTWVTGVSFPGQARQVALRGQRAYVAAGDGGLAIVDISNPFNIRWLGSYSSPGEVKAVEIDANYTYLINDKEGLLALKIQNDQVVKLARLDLKVNAMWLDGGQLYLASHRGVEVVKFDESTTTPFNIVAHFDIEGGAQHITGNRYQLNVSDGTSVFNLSRTLPLTLASQLTPGNTITDLEQNDKWLYISTRNQLISADLRDINTPKLINRYPLLTNINNFTCYRGMVYFSGEETITALQLMPDTRHYPQGESMALLQLPEALGTGNYHVAIRYQDGSQEIVKNAIRINMHRFSKPNISIEKFNKLLEQQKQNAVTHPNL